MSGQARQQIEATSSVPPETTGLLQRSCDCGNHTSNGKCDSCQKQKGTLQRSATSSGPTNFAPSIVHEVLRTPGQPLDHATRAFFEPRFGHDFSRTPVTSVAASSLQHKLTVGAPNTREEFEADRVADSVMNMSHRVASPTASEPVHDFSQVRIHADSRAAASAQAVNARAYTVGHDIVFADQQYAPHTSAGRRLLAHELTHTVQQTGSGGSPSASLQRTIGDGHDLQSPRFAADPVLEACFDNETLLRFGSRGPAVEKVQQALVDAGFPLPQFGVDGIFGAETAGAVRNYQRARGLVPDALVGPLTMGQLDSEFAGPGPAPPGPGPAPPGPGPAPPGPGPAPPGPGPAPPGPGPAPPGPGPAPPGPGPAPPGPGPAPPAETITSQTVVADPGPRTRTTIGVNEEVTLTHAPGSAAWSTSVGPAPLSATNGVSVVFTAPDTFPAKTQRITVTAGAARIEFEVVAPDSVAMDRQPGTGVQHTVNRPRSGIQTRVFLGPATVNFSRVRYRELDVNATATVPGVYSCFATGTGHCGAGGGGNPCPDKALTNTVVAGMGTLSDRGDCACSGDCNTAPPFVAGSISFNIPYEYRVGTGAFHPITNVPQLHTLGADLSTLTSSKAGASGTTTVAAATLALPDCIGPCPV